MDTMTTLGELRTKGSARAAQLVSDPRPDLTEDSSTWERLLSAAYAESGANPFGSFAILNGFRCRGCRLVPNERTGRLRLERGDELNVDAYTGLRATYLLPKSETVRRLLQGIKR